MGITIHYHFFTPPGFSPADHPAAAHRSIDDAVSLAAQTLHQAGIPFRMPDRDVDRTTFEQVIIPAGLAEGAEPLTFGWHCDQQSQHWSGYQFAKTEYAADFAVAHVPYCHVLKRLAQSAYVERITDEGGYLPDGDLTRLLKSQAASQALLAKVSRLLDQTDFTVAHPLPGGAIAYGNGKPAHNG